MKYGVCYYVLGCIEPYLEFVEDESLEAVIQRVKTNDFIGVRFARAGLDEVPYINICDDKGFCLYRIPVTELQHNDLVIFLITTEMMRLTMLKTTQHQSRTILLKSHQKKQIFFKFLKSYIVLLYGY